MLGYTGCISELPYDHCLNGIKDKGETEIDCGGEDCPDCTEIPIIYDCDYQIATTGQGCDNLCPPCDCEDQIANGGLDCGGDCPDCPDAFEITETGGNLNYGRSGTELFRIDDNTVVIFSVNQAIELYDIENDVFTVVNNSENIIKSGMAYVQLHDEEGYGDVYICGGGDSTNGSTNAYLFSNEDRTINSLPSLSIPRHNHTANVFDNNVVMILGGKPETTDAEFFDIDTNESIVVNDFLNYTHQEHTCTEVIDNNTFILWGGNENTSVIERIAFDLPPNPNIISDYLVDSLSFKDDSTRFKHNANFVKWGGQGKLLITGGRYSLYNSSTLNGDLTIISNTSSTMSDTHQSDFMGYDHSTIIIDNKVLYSGGAFGTPTTQNGTKNMVLIEENGTVNNSYEGFNMSLIHNRTGHDMIIIKDTPTQKKVLVVGGKTGTNKGEIMTFLYE